MIGRNPPSAIDESPELRSFDDYDLRLGDLMRGERATLGKSLLDVQRELKIKATYIAAIENCDPTAFETPGFIAGYVRSYARYLHMDPEWAFSTFCAESKFETSHGMSAGASSNKGKRAIVAKGDPLADPNPAFLPRGEAMFSQIEPGAIGSVAVLLALIGVIGFGGWTVLQEVQRVQFTPVDQAPGVTTSLDPLDGARIAATTTTDDVTIPNPNAEALDRLYRPQALDVPVLVARDGPISAVDPASFGALAALQREPEETPEVERPIFENEPERAIQVVANDAPELVLVAVRPAWVRVRGAGGTVLLEKVLDAGEEYVLPQTEEPPTLRVGESGAVYFAVNGEHFGPAGPDGVVTKDIVLSAESLKDVYTLADMTQDQDLARMVADAQAVTAEPEATEAPAAE